MYEDILDKVDFDDKDVLEQFIKGVLKHMDLVGDHIDQINRRLNDIDGDIQDIKEMVKMDII